MILNLKRGEINRITICIPVSSVLCLFIFYKNRAILLANVSHRGNNTGSSIFTKINGTSHCKEKIEKKIKHPLYDSSDAKYPVLSWFT